jgi:YVTN family beta-propeller protein
MAGYKVVGAFSIGGSDVFRSPVLIGSSLWVLKQQWRLGNSFTKLTLLTMTDSVATVAALLHHRAVWLTTAQTFGHTTAINRFSPVDPSALTETSFGGSTGGFNNFREAEGIAFDGSDLWVANYRNDGTNHPLLGYDPFTQAGVYSNNFSSDNFGVHWDGTHIWVSDTGADVVRKIDPTAGTILATVTVGDKPEAVTSGAGSVWVGNETSNDVSRIDTATNTVTATISAPSGAAVRTVHFAFGLCWFGGSSSLFGIDPATNTVTVTVASVEAKEIISDATYLYCLEPTQNRMTKIGRLGGIFTDGAKHL